MIRDIIGEHMIEIKNILIPAIRNEIILFAAEYGIKLFPNAVYHIVSVIPQMRKRSMYTRLYIESFEKLARDAFHDLEFILYSRGCLAVKKTLLRGNVVKEIKKYVLNNKIDLIIISSSASPTPPPRLVGSTASKIISALNVPSLVITPASYERKEFLLDSFNGIGIICSDPRFIDRSLMYAYSILSKKRGRLRLVFPHNADRELMVNVQQRLRDMGLSVDLVLVKGDNVDDFIKNALGRVNDLNLLISLKKPHHGLRLPLISGRLSRYDRLLIGLSPVPILLV